MREAAPADHGDGFHASPTSTADVPGGYVETTAFTVWRTQDTPDQVGAVSIHLMLCAAKTRIKPSTKLVLLCLAEAARDGDRRAFPGAERLGEWAGVSRSRVFELLDDLGELRLIEQTRRGQKHQRAEFVVFPEGCCDVHGPISGSSTQDTETPVDSPTDRTLRTSQGPLFGSQGPVQTLSGSDVPDPSLTTNPNYNQGLPTHVALPSRPLHSVPSLNEDCEHGVDRHSSCRDCAKQASA